MRYLSLSSPEPNLMPEPLLGSSESHRLSFRDSDPNIFILFYFFQSWLLRRLRLNCPMFTCVTRILKMKIHLKICAFLKHRPPLLFFAVFLFFLCSWMEFPVPLPDFVVSQRSTDKNVFPVIDLTHRVFMLKERGEEKVQERPVCFDVKMGRCMNPRWKTVSVVFQTEFLSVQWLQSEERWYPCLLISFPYFYWSLGRIGSAKIPLMHKKNKQTKSPKHHNLQIK